MANEQVSRRLIISLLQCKAEAQRVLLKIQHSPQKGVTMDNWAPWEAV